MTDAAHLLTDMSSFIISLVAIHLSERSPTKVLTYGWHRAEVLGALISIEAIWIMTAVLVKGGNTAESTVEMLKYTIKKIQN